MLRKSRPRLAADVATAGLGAWELNSWHEASGICKRWRGATILAHVERGQSILGTARIRQFRRCFQRAIWNLVVYADLLRRKSRYEAFGRPLKKYSRAICNLKPETELRLDRKESEAKRLDQGEVPRFSEAAWRVPSTTVKTLSNRSIVNNLPLPVVVSGLRSHYRLHLLRFQDVPQKPDCAWVQVVCRQNLAEFSAWSDCDRRTERLRQIECLGRHSLGAG